MRKGTVQRLLIIPEDDAAIIDKLKKERGWQEPDIKVILNHFATKRPPQQTISDEEIVSQVKQIRDELSKNRRN